MKRIKWYALFVLVIIGGFFGGSYFTSVKYKAEDKSVVVQASKTDLEKIMDEENFKKETFLRARKVANDEKKAIEIERNKQALAVIETEYQAIRTEEVALVGSKDVSLK